MSLRRSARLSIDKVGSATQELSKKAAPTTSIDGKKGLNGTQTLKKRRGGAVSPTAPNASEKNAANKDDTFAIPALPVTPKNKRRKAQSAATPPNPPPLTPTPSGVKLIVGSSSTPSTPAAPLDRPAEPHITNAPLHTPGGSRVVAFNGAHGSQDSQGVPLPVASTTTANLLENACEHLIKVDPKLRPIVEKFQCKMFSPEGLAEEIDPFTALASSIMGQQVSGAAAASIKNKFIGLFPCPTQPPPSKYFPAPAVVAAASIPHLRTAGLSQRKAEYIQGLAEKFASGELSARWLLTASDEEVMEKLVAVRGLGRWSVEMFACFGLKRMDVFSTGDLGVQRGMAAFVGKDVAKLKNKGGKWKYMSEQDMLDISARFAPYRSLFMWYMWRVEDVDTKVLE